MHLLSDIKESLLHLLFPHVCEGCGSDILEADQFLCIKCHTDLPKTDFHLYPNNPIEKMFWGRLPLTSATAQYYFTKSSKMQQLMHGLKYKGNKELGLYLGRLMGYAFAKTNRFSYIDALVPLPLFPAKEQKRGYNQATILCQGIAEVLQKPIINNVVIRTTFTDTQTKKNRVERWTNMEGKFKLVNAESIRDKHVLLIDDVLTTGATLEACGVCLLRADNTRLSIATLCYSSR